MLGTTKMDDIIKRWKEVLGGDYEGQVDLAESYINGTAIIKVCCNRLKDDKSCFLTNVERKCNVKESEKKPPYPGPHGVYNPTTWNTYGRRVVEWLESEAKNYGLFTGRLTDTKYQAIAFT